VDRRGQQHDGPQQPLLGQLAARHDGVLGARRFVCGPAAGGNEQAGCDPAQVSTSHRNRHHDNVMGRDRQGSPDPNGTDFWWDEFADNVNNCWFANTGKDGSAASITSDPDRLPDDCATSRGRGNPAQQSELFNCLGDITFNTSTCPWFTTPPEPQP
jgi:hypothetical protein